MVMIDPADLSKREGYFLLTSMFIPRPIAFVGTASPQGILNCAPYSFAAGVSANPPIMSVSIGDKGRGQKKDTLANIEDTGVFTINMVDEGIMEAMHLSSTPLPPEVSEFEAFGLNVRPSIMIDAPGVAESPVTMELKLRDIIRIEDARVSLVLGEVVLYHVKEEVMEDGLVSAAAMKPVGRLGKDAYTVVRETVTLDPISR